MLIFERGAEGWAYAEALRPPQGVEVGDGFGERVGISGDTLAANDYDGRVHLFTRTGAAWTYTTTVDAPSPDGTEDSFGGIFALSGDTLVTARQTFIDNGANVERAARVYTRSGGQWTLTQTLKPDYPAQGRRDVFAFQIELNGAHLAISSIYPPATAPIAGLQNPGLVYLYTRTANGWTPKAHLSILELQRGTDIYTIDFALAPSLILSIDHSGGLDANGQPNQRALMTTEL